MLAMARKNLLRDILVSRGMNIYRLAKATQMPYHNVQNIVQSPSIPDGTNYKTLRKIARALDVGIDDLEEEK